MNGYFAKKTPSQIFDRDLNAPLIFSWLNLKIKISSKNEKVNFTPLKLDYRPKTSSKIC